MASDLCVQLGAGLPAGLAEAIDEGKPPAKVRVSRPGGADEWPVIVHSGADEDELLRAARVAGYDIGECRVFTEEEWASRHIQVLRGPEKPSIVHSGASQAELEAAAQKAGFDLQECLVFTDEEWSAYVSRQAKGG